MTDAPEHVAAAYLQRIADNYSGIAFLGDGRGRLVHLSDWFYDYTGLAPGAAPDLAIIRAAHPDDRQGVLQGWREAVSAQKPFRAAFRLQSKSGEWEWFWSVGRPMGPLADEPPRWFGVCLRSEDLAAMQLAGYDGLAAALSGAHAASPAAEDNLLTASLVRAAGPESDGDPDSGVDEADPKGLRLTAAASYALAAALLIEDGSASALAKAQDVLSQLSRELVQLSRAGRRPRNRTA